MPLPIVLSFPPPLCLSALYLSLSALLSLSLCPMLPPSLKQRPLRMAHLLCPVSATARLGPRRRQELHPAPRVGAREPGHLGCLRYLHKGARSEAESVGLKLWAIWVSDGSFIHCTSMPTLRNRLQIRATGIPTSSLTAVPNHQRCIAFESAENRFLNVLITENNMWGKVLVSCWSIPWCACVLVSAEPRPAVCRSCWSSRSILKQETVC